MFVNEYIWPKLMGRVYTTYHDRLMNSKYKYIIEDNYANCFFLLYFKPILINLRSYIFIDLVCKTRCPCKLRSAFNLYPISLKDDTL